jgi:Integrase
MARQLEKLSALKVNRASTPGYLGDGGGLYLQVSASGSKSWVFRFQLAGRAREMGLGALHTFGLKEARERAQRCRQLVADGIDPIEEKQADRQRKQQADARAVTFGACCEKYIEAHRAGWRNEKHAAQWDATLRTYCAAIWKLDVAAIDTALVLKCLEPIWLEKTETASRLRGRIESVLAWATVRKFRTGDNPAQWRNHLDQLLPKRSKVQKVEHRAALPYADAAEFMAKLRQRQGLAARALELQILTATRPGEAAGAQWDEFDLDTGIWIIPGERMKAGKEHRIPLSPAAVTLLQSLIPTTPKGKRMHVVGHVFPGVKGRPLTTAAGMALLKEMKTGVTAHGFRSTFRDWAGDTTSHPREIIEAAMAHRLKDAAEAAYQRSDLLQRRAKLMNDWARYCAGKK